MTDPSGLYRLLSVASRRYSREPDTRATSARLVLSAALNLYAAHTSPGEAALAASEVIAELAQAERLQRRAG